MPRKLQRNNFLWLLLLLSSVFTSAIFAQTDYNSTSGGNWFEVTWNPNSLPGELDDVDIEDNITIPADSTVIINNLNIGKDALLTVEGNLVVYGSVTMDNNGSGFDMAANAFVNIYGDFYASNQVNIAISSYLIIQGDFTKQGANSSHQGSIEVNSGHIYIFGEVDTDWENFTGCGGSYDGETTDESVESCDYGSETDYENNYEDIAENIPPEIAESINCFNIAPLEDEITCEVTAFTFSTDSIAEVNYQWQQKIPGGDWTDVSMDTTAFSYTIPNVTAAISGNKYRVILEARDSYPGVCNVVVSNAATITVISQDFDLGPISGETNICLPSSEKTYTIQPVDNAASYTWNIPSGWDITSGAGTESITVDFNGSSGNGTISVEVTNLCGITKSTSLGIFVAQSGQWTGATDTNWNEPSNWGCNIVPDLTTNVLIPSSLTNYPVLSSGNTGEVHNIHIEAGASLEVSGNSLVIAGTITNSGSFDSSAGTIVMQGTTAQDIPAETFVKDRLLNLTVDNSSGVALKGNLEVTGVVKAENGNLDSAGFLKLISNNNGTALIDGAGNGEVLGTVTMQRYLDSAFGYKYFSSPFSNSKVDDFSVFMDLSDPDTNFPHFYTYYENREDSEGNAANGWVSFIDPNSNLNILNGYAANLGSSAAPVTIELSGEVNNGDQEILLHNHNRTYTKGFNLVGNPYPSPIDWNASSGWTRQNIDNAIYFFKASTDDQYGGTYSSYIKLPDGSISTDGTSSSVIPSMQGFFVHVSEGSGFPSQGILGMTNEVRVTDNSREFYKTSERTNSPSLLQLSAGFTAEDRKDRMVIYFSNFNEPNFEREKDALKLMNTDLKVPSFFSISTEGEKLSINGMPFPQQGIKKLPLGIRSEKEGTMRISLENIENLPSNFYVYLIDLEKNLGQNLNKKPSYEFKYSGGENNSRFELMFSDKPVSDPAVAFNEPFSIENKGAQVWANINLESGEAGILRVNNVSGQILEVRKVSGKEKLEITGIKNSGIYFFSLTSGKQNHSKKVLIKK